MSMLSFVTKWEREKIIFGIITISDGVPKQFGTSGDPATICEGVP